MMFTGPIRNTLATVVSLLLIGGLYYASTVPEYWDPVVKFKVISFPVIIFVVNMITKLTTWKGDDSLWVVVRKKVFPNYK